MKIGDLAKAAQCTVETVRYYEKEGLLPAPARTAGNYRSYGAGHVERLRFIRNCRALDMTHDEIRALLGFMDQPTRNCCDVNRLLDAHIGHVDVRIEELAKLRAQLVELRKQCASPAEISACGIIQGLSAMDTGPKAEQQTHLR